jgi:hypothetical protein
MGADDMMVENYALIAVGLVFGTSLILFFSRNWRLSLSALGAQYIGVFGLVVLTWPLEMAVIKLIAGWIAAAVLGLDLGAISPTSVFRQRPHPSLVLFHLILTIILGITIFSLTPEVAKWLLSATYEQILAGLWLCAMGILQFSITTSPLRVIFGLLTFLSGFEVLYATVNTSSFVAGFLAILNLGIALVGIFWLGKMDVGELQ